MIGYPKPIPSRRLKKTREWEQARKELKQIYAEKGITKCELCGTANFLSFAHRNKRRNTTSKELASFYHTLLLCVPCHQTLEQSREKTEQAFSRLRPNIPDSL
jgi:aspartyl/asparaginyl beta-hydroxylase (cupin superfamily)